MKLIQDLREFIELLNQENVRYLLIGGWAYNRYAEPRTTGDIDFFIDESAENQSKLRTVLEKFGFTEVLPPANCPLFRKKIIMLGNPPNRIDLAIKIDGIKFEEAWKNKENGSLDGLPVNYISLCDLIKNKKATKREKDKLDVKMLTKMANL